MSKNALSRSIFPGSLRFCRENQKDRRKCAGQIVHACAVGRADDFDKVLFEPVV